MKVILSEQQVGNLIKSLADKAKSLISKKQPEPVQQSTQNTVDVYQQTKMEWSKINDNMSDIRAFAESTGPDMYSTRMQAVVRAESIILKKLGVNRIEMGINIEDEKVFRNPDNTYTYLVIVKKT